MPSELMNDEKYLAAAKTSGKRNRAFLLPVALCEPVSPNSQFDLHELAMPIPEVHS